MTHEAAEHSPFREFFTDRQWEQYRIGRDANRAGFPRAAPHDESEWRSWLAGWDSVATNQDPPHA